MRNCSLLFILIFFCNCVGIKNLKQESQLFTTELNEKVLSLDSTDVLTKSVNGNWQLRISGDPYELGYKKGILTKELYQQQEAIFFSRVAEFVPNKTYQKQMVSFLKWYNRSILDHVPVNFKKEIYALSQFTSTNYDFLGSKYERNLLLHSAHDIGHAMQDLMLVGCSSIALWDDFTDDGNLLIGRNFDFYVNDAFAENKIVEFIQPANGYKYASVTWPGMVGVVSGMNEKGITVTLNAGKSNIPLRGKTPVSIVARAILQDAKNIEEAITIAQSFEVFVAESFLIGSAADNKAVVVEMSPKKFDVYEQNNGKLICTNHFQSGRYETDKRNQEQLLNSHSYHQLKKLDTSFKNNQNYNVTDVVTVLRDVSGLQNEDIGLGNEKALNQLLAHHTVVFKPKELKMWVSNNPYQLGAFDAYDLNAIFKFKELQPVKELEIKSDSLIYSEQYQKYQKFKVLNNKINEALSNEVVLEDHLLNTYQQLNPEFWVVYKTLGDYYYLHKAYLKAEEMFKVALTKEISAQEYRNEIEKKLMKSKKKQ